MSQNTSCLQAAVSQFPEKPCRVPYPDFRSKGQFASENCDDLPSILSRLKKSLTYLDLCDPSALSPEEDAGSRMIFLLSESIANLQDSFLETLQDGLKKCGADLAAKRTLRLDGKARLVPVGDDPQDRVVEEFLAACPQLASMFTELAIRASLLYALRDLQTAIFSAVPAQAYAALGADMGFKFYQVSLKGDMSHFYFSRA